MKILWLSTGTINCEPIIGSLDAIKKPDWEIEVRNYFAAGFYGQWLERHYDLILYISVSSGPHLPCIADLLSLKLNGKRTVHLCFDAACPDWHPLLRLYNENNIFDLTVNIDGNANWPSAGNSITTVAPIDPRPFNPSVTKEIECGFAGGWESPGRHDTIKFLKEQDLITVRSQIESHFTYNEYAQFMSQCKMVVNMDQSGGGSKQVKARVIEAGLAKACLFEPEGSIAANWFSPNIDYVEYKDKEDLAFKIQVKSRTHEIRNKIASNLHEKVMTKYSAKHFWDLVL